MPSEFAEQVQCFENYKSLFGSTKKKYEGTCHVLSYPTREAGVGGEPKLSWLLNSSSLAGALSLSKVLKAACAKFSSKSGRAVQVNTGVL